MKKMTVGSMIDKLKGFDPETEVVIYDDIGKGVRRSHNVTYPHSFAEMPIVYALCEDPIMIDDKRYDNKYSRRMCIVIS